VASLGSTFDDFPSPDFPTAPRDLDKELVTPARFGCLSEDRECTPSGGARPRRSQDDHDPPIVTRRGDDPFADTRSSEPLSDREPSQDTATTNRSQQFDLGRRPGSTNDAAPVRYDATTDLLGLVF
jgi:hypothetical protein